MYKFFEIVLDCLTSTSSLIILVLGFYLIYGVMKVINMAHGDMVMLGSYMTAQFSNMYGNFWIGVAAAFIICFSIGFIIEKSVIRYLYDKDNVMTLLATWGISLITIECVRLFFGGEGIYVDPPLQGVFLISGVSFSCYNTIIIGMSLIATISVFFLFRFTRFGILLRAAIDSPIRASLFSINVRKLYAIAFALGTGLAGLAGAILSPVTAITPNMGIDFAFLSFLVVICGGFKSFLSPIIGAAVVASSKTILSSFYGTTISTIGMLILILIIIYIRPGGILPEKS